MLNPEHTLKEKNKQKDPFKSLLSFTSVKIEDFMFEWEMGRFIMKTWPELGYNKF